MKTNKAIIFLLILSVCLLCAGCLKSYIKEDEIREDLVKLDPQAGLTKEITFICYSRLANERYLAGLSKTVNLRGGERAEKVMIEAVLNAPAAITGEEGNLFPDDTKIVDLSIDGSILYLTLSKEFIDQSELTQVETQLKKEYDNGELTQVVYEKSLEKAKLTFSQRRELAVYALVNTITGYSSRTRVMILVDTNENGTGIRLTRMEIFGREDSMALLEPLSFNETLVVTPEKMVDLLFEEMLEERFEAMYQLFTDTSSEQLPDYNVFETSIRAAGRLKSFQASAATPQVGDEQIVNVNITMSDSSGADVYLENRPLLMVNKDGLFRPEYTSFMQLLEEH